MQVDNYVLPSERGKFTGGTGTLVWAKYVWPMVVLVLN